MSQQPMSLERSVRLIRRHRVLVGAMTAGGILIGVIAAVLRPPLLSSEALVVIPQGGPNIATEVVIANSEPVLSGALRNIHPAMSLQTLEDRVGVRSLTSGVVSVTVKGSNAAQAQSAANAVANSYIDYVGGAHSPVGHVPAQLLEQATPASGSAPVQQDIIYGLIGALAGLAAGIILVIIVGRIDHTLRGRDDIANSIGVPVLAAIPVRHPSDAAGWTKLLDDYEPGAVVGWRLRQVLQALGVTGADMDDHAAEGGVSLTVLSLASDAGALALGPQLAIFAASVRIPTALVIGPQQDTNATAALRTACAAPPRSSNRPSFLRTVAADGARADVPQGAGLLVVVAVVDGKAPQLPDTIPTMMTVLAVSAGAGTAEQLARVATVAAADGHEVVGFLVADPESDDQTTGRIPRLARPVHQMSAAPERQDQQSSPATESRKQPGYREQNVSHQPAPDWRWGDRTQQAIAE